LSLRHIPLSFINSVCNLGGSIFNLLFIFRWVQVLALSWYFPLNTQPLNFIISIGKINFFLMGPSPIIIRDVHCNCRSQFFFDVQLGSSLVIFRFGEIIWVKRWGPTFTPMQSASCLSLWFLCHPAMAVEVKSCFWAWVKFNTWGIFSLLFCL